MALSTLLWVLVGAAAVGLWVGREPAGSDPVQAARRALQGAQELELSAEQWQRLQTILQTFEHQIIVEDRVFQDKLAAAAAQADDDIESLLTPEQRQRYEMLALGVTPP